MNCPICKLNLFPKEFQSDTDDPYIEYQCYSSINKHFFVQKIYKRDNYLLETIEFSTLQVTNNRYGCSIGSKFYANAQYINIKQRINFDKFYGKSEEEIFNIFKLYQSLS